MAQGLEEVSPPCGHSQAGGTGVLPVPLGLPRFELSLLLIFFGLSRLALEVQTSTWHPPRGSQLPTSLRASVATADVPLLSSLSHWC